MRNRWSVLAVLFFARMAMAFQFQSVATVAPLIGDVYGVGLADIGLLIGLYFAPGVLVAIPDSTLAARLGDRRVVIAAMVLMPLGGALMWAAYNASIAMVFSFGPVLLISRGWTLAAASSAVSLCMVIAASLACSAILLAALIWAPAGSITTILVATGTPRFVPPDRSGGATVARRPVRSAGTHGGGREG